MNLYKIKFNDYGEDYVIAEDWNEAGLKVKNRIDEIMKDSINKSETKIKEVIFLADDKKETCLNRLIL